MPHERLVTARCTADAPWVTTGASGDVEASQDVGLVWLLESCSAAQFVPGVCCKKISQQCTKLVTRTAGLRRSSRIPAVSLSSGTGMPEREAYAGELRSQANHP